MALEGRSALNTAIKGLPIISSRSVLGAHTLSHNGKSFSVDRYSVGPHVVLRSDAYNTSFHNLPDELREFTNSIQEYLAKILLDFEKKGRNAQKLGVDRDGTCGIG